MEGMRASTYETVILPIVTHGDCRRWKYCKGFDVALGDDLCVKCWDNGARVPIRSSVDVIQ
jgi:hypothetical protein